MATITIQATSAPYQAPNLAVLRLVAAAPILQDIIVYRAIGAFMKPTFKRPIKACLQAVKLTKKRRAVEAKEDMVMAKSEKADVEWTW